MQNKLFIIAAVIVLIVFGIWIYNSSTSNEQNQERIKVAATIFPLADVAKNIGGSKVEVVNVVKPGASPHTFEVNPSDVKQLQGVQVLFAIGGGLDNWTADLLAVDSEMALVVVDEGVEKKEFRFEHHHEESDAHEKEGAHDKHRENQAEHEHESKQHDEHEGYDPHYWLSAKNAKIIAGNVAKALIEADPENEDFYRDNLRNYQNELNSAANEIRRELGEIENNHLIVFHESWNYFADEFGLDIVGVFALSPGKEPTPQQLANLYDRAQDYGVKAVFSEPQLSPETIRPFVEDLDLELYVLDPLGGIEDRDSLINLLKYNAQTIKQALQ